MAIHKDTGTWNAGTKEDSGMNLAGNQHVSDPQGDHSGVYDPALPWASVVDPLYRDCFDMGHATTSVQGYLNPTSGNVNI